jgi:hypothetical protein
VHFDWLGFAQNNHLYCLQILASAQTESSLQTEETYEGQIPVNERHVQQSGFHYKD